MTSTVSAGLFSVKLNGASQFGATAFDSSQRWLAVNVRCPSGSGGYSGLERQELNATPYAVYSLKAGTSAGLQGVPVASAAPTTGQALKYNGTQWAPGGYQGLVVVAKSGGDYTTIGAALAAITASENNRYLIKVLPGVYTERVTMERYVDIEGSGELNTKITYPGSGSSTTGTVVGANDAELRWLMVENTGGSTHAKAIYNDSASPRLTHLTVSASGGSISYGVYNSSSSSVIQDSVIGASGGTNNYGIYNSATSSSYTVTINNSQVTGGTNTIRNDAEFTTYIGASLLDGGASLANGGTLTCAGVYDEAYTFYASTCP